MIGVRTSRSCRRNRVTCIRVWPSKINISVLTQGELPLTSEVGRTTTSNRGDLEQQQHKMDLQRGKKLVEWHFPWIETNLVTGKSSFKPPNKKRQTTHKYLPVLCGLLLPLWCFLVFSPAGKEQNTTEIRKLYWWGGEKEKVRNEGQLSEITSAMRFPQTWCSYALLLTSVVVVTNFGRKRCICLYAHLALSSHSCCS